ncbi:4-hydroxy-tetrahydrodipicolinate synthase [Buchnera aphidicola]|uniref:4-hydroxy-tetrahydrodipicolinate synthase n=1 Tax=Buchnera aphidicola subsp. Tuberolachnus salignus TaxID=98804 RepID=A0A160SVR5_BUCTT|nr:4-hydroxy-tetrahydrodipicolinate synthase [Buchnera aphidicola]CUR53047.1 4-hydroxy-tetrahydrodipicolinate synthase [Buchnera aphidicola (Tuberolachnus salignus)]
MFKGSIVALITPMDLKGNLCKKSLKNLIEYHILNKTTAIVSVGTTGESATLTPQEHTDIILYTVEIANQRIPIIAGTGSNSTSESIYLTKKFENSGVKACLSVTPYYNRPTQEGLYQHFKSITENTTLPQILYNVPLRTGCDLLPKTIIRLSKFENIIGLKDATGDLTRVQKILFSVKKNFLLISGDDITALDFIKLGGHGVISVTANIAAKEIAKICQLALKGKYIKAYKENKKLLPLHKILFQETNPIPIKSAAQYLKLITTDNLRLPLTKLTHIMRLQLISILKKINLKKNNI